MQGNCTSYNLLKPNVSSISMESTRSREPISNTFLSDNNYCSSSQNRNNFFWPNSKTSFQDLSSSNKIIDGCSPTQQILIDEGTIDCLSLSFPPKASTLSKNEKLFKDDNSSSTSEDDGVDQLRIDEGITPTIITPTTLSNNQATTTKLKSNNSSSIILDTLIGSTNGPSTLVGCTSLRKAIPSGFDASNSHTSPIRHFPLQQHNFPYLTSSSSSSGRGGFLDRLLTFSPSNASANMAVGGGAVSSLKTPNSYQDRVSLFTTSPQKVESLSSPNGSTHSNGVTSNLTNGALSNDESPNFTNFSQHSYCMGDSNHSVNSVIVPNVLSTSNVHNNLLNTTRQSTHSNLHAANSSHAKLYSNHFSPPSHSKSSHSSVMQSGIQKHTINQKELRRATEKTKNNLKHFLEIGNSITKTFPLSVTNNHQPIDSLLTEKNTKPNPSPTNPIEETEVVTKTKLPSPESEVPLKQKLKMRSYKLL